jgi:hypothetical protein
MAQDRRPETINSPDGPFDQAMIAELRRVASAPARSGRQAQAKVAAIRTLERLGRRRSSPVPDFRTWHPGGPFEDLDACDSAEMRASWWARLSEMRR